MHKAIRFLSLVALVALDACAKSPGVAPPTFQYPPLLHQAGIEGSVRFRVLLDSTGRPQPKTFKVVATFNPGFNYAVRNALAGWRDSTLAGRLFEHTVMFVLMDSAGTDSIARCRSSSHSWATCARLTPPTV